MQEAFGAHVSLGGLQRGVDEQQAVDAVQLLVVGAQGLPQAVIDVTRLRRQSLNEPPRNAAK